MRLSFFKKTMGYILLPVIITLAVLTYFSYSLSRQALETKIDTQMATFAKDINTVVKQTFNSTKDANVAINNLMQEAQSLVKMVDKMKGEKEDKN